MMADEDEKGEKLKREPSLKQKKKKKERFRTAPGGGKNRASGGRSSASAYVSPLTLPSESVETESIQPFQIKSSLQKEAALIGTQPSLARASQSLRINTSREKSVGNGKALLLAFFFFTFGAGVAWLALLAAPDSQIEDRSGDSLNQIKINKTRNLPASRTSGTESEVVKGNLSSQNNSISLRAASRPAEKKTAPMPTSSKASARAPKKTLISPRPDTSVTSEQKIEAASDDTPEKPVDDLKNPPRELWLE